MAPSRDRVVVDIGDQVEAELSVTGNVTPLAKHQDGSDQHHELRSRGSSA